MCRPPPFFSGSDIQEFSSVLFPTFFPLQEQRGALQCEWYITQKYLLSFLLLDIVQSLRHLPVLGLRQEDSDGTRGDGHGGEDDGGDGGVDVG